MSKGAFVRVSVTRQLIRERPEGGLYIAAEDEVCTFDTPTTKPGALTPAIPQPRRGKVSSQSG